MVTAINGLSRYDISELFVDREGSLWIGVVGHGLMRWVGQDQWEAYTAASGLSDDIIRASLRDRTGRLWIGTESGLDTLAPGANTPKAWQAPGIQTTRSGSLAETADGAVWMGSAAGSLVRIDPKTLAGTQWKVPVVFRVLSDGGHRVLGSHRCRPLRGGCHGRRPLSAPGRRPAPCPAAAALHRPCPGSEKSAVGCNRRRALPAR